jgi:hypothetical protein
MNRLTLAEETIESLQIQIMQLRYELTQCENALIKKIKASVNNGEKLFPWQTVNDRVRCLLEQEGYHANFDTLRDGVITITKRK